MDALAGAVVQDTNIHNVTTSTGRALIPLRPLPRGLVDRGVVLTTVPSTIRNQRYALPGGDRSGHIVLLRLGRARSGKPSSSGVVSELFMGHGGIAGKDHSHGVLAAPEERMLHLQVAGDAVDQEVDVDAVGINALREKTEGHIKLELGRLTEAVRAYGARLAWAEVNHPNCCNAIGATPVVTQAGHEPCRVAHARAQPVGHIEEGAPLRYIISLVGHPHPLELEIDGFLRGDDHGLCLSTGHSQRTATVV